MIPVRSSAPSSTPRLRTTSPVADVYLAGVGSVGSALLRQVATLSDEATRLRLVGACTSRHSVWAAGELPPLDAPEALRQGPPPNWPRLLERLERAAERPFVFVDATGSVEVAGHYERLLSAGAAVVTPSKHANTQEQSTFDRLQAAAQTHGAPYLYETTVGAGLPVLHTVQSLVATGDRIRTIRGAVSGTLTFVFDQLRQGVALSDAVQEASARGYAEPDVRDDLSGEDVARKFIILARTAGVPIERAEVEVASLVPPTLQATDAASFLDALASFDDDWRKRVADAGAAGEVLQYAGELSGGRVQIGVQRVAADAPLGQLRGTDNLIEIYTERYNASPIVVQGPGAGPEVTAAGVLADVLRAAATMRKA